MTDDQAQPPPSVLLLHGVGSSSATWWRMADDLRQLGWQVSTADLLGHGGRPAGPHTADWLSALAEDVAATTGGRSFDLVIGHSLGALVALRLLAQDPSTARAVLLEDPPSLGGSFTVGEVADDLEDGVLRTLADPDAEADRLRTDNPLWASLDVASVLENRRRLDATAVAAQLRSSGWDLSALVADCPVPVGLVAADGPATTLVEPTRSPLLAALPQDQVRLVVAGHGIHRDRPALWLHHVTALASTLLDDAQPGPSGA